MSRSQFVDSPPSSPYKAYLEESQTPLAGLVFTLPLFVLYHVGVWYIRKTGDIPWANGADALIANLLCRLGVGGPLISLLVVTASLLFVHEFRHGRWRFPRQATLILMLCESLIFALPPFMLGIIVNTFLASAGSGEDLPTAVNIFLSFGAGVYEEYLFRFLLMGFLFLLVRRTRGKASVRAYAAIMIAQAVLFSLFHHLPGSREALTWSYVWGYPFLRAFAFRTLAGLYFAYLYQERGFGIAAGSHAFYDVIAVLLRAFR